MSKLELKLPPVALTLMLAALMWLASGAVAGFDLSRSWRIGGSLGFAAVGSAIALAGVWSFRRARTTVNPLAPGNSSQLVTTGVFRLSRNPMYLGLLLALLGWALFLADALALILALGFIPFMNRFQIGPEERALQSAFGDDFDRYCRRVRRWI